MSLIVSCKEVRVIVLYMKRTLGKHFGDKLYCWCIVFYIAGLLQRGSYGFDGYEIQHTRYDDFDGDCCSMAILSACWTKSSSRSRSKRLDCLDYCGYCSAHIPSEWYNKADMQVNMGPLKRRIQEIRYCEHIKIKRQTGCFTT